ncbi:MAG: signal peptidase II [Clostridia bacterium]|nr:signal peptidase II [Clostridia bacterium]
MSVFLTLLICAALIGADQLFKFLVIEYLKPIGFVNVIDGVLRFRYVENTGAIFGSFAAHTAVLTVFSLILLIATIIFLVKNKDKSKIVNVCLVLMISGGLGNIIDRIRLKYVVDFIEPLFVDFAVFNFADCLITVGAFALVIYLTIDIIKDGKKHKATVNNTTEKSNGTT